MAADAAGNDITNVFIPVAGFLAFAPYGTAYPTATQLGTYGFAPTSPWKRAGLITVDGGFGWTEDRASAIEFYQGDYQTNAGNGTVALTVKLAETGATVRELLRNSIADSNGVINVDVDAEVHWALYTEEVDKHGRVRRRVAGNAWLESNAADKSTRGEVNGSEATFRVRRDPGNSNRHFREAIVDADSTPAPYIASVLPSGAAVGATVAIEGAYLGTSGADISALTIDGVAVVTKTWIRPGLVNAVIPAGVAAAANVVLTTTSGGVSNTYAYTAA